MKEFFKQLLGSRGSLTPAIALYVYVLGMIVIALLMWGGLQIYNWAITSPIISH
jgi:hypothetical protein